MDCVKGCEFQVYEEEEFHCVLYNERLKVEIRDIPNAPGYVKGVTTRCEKCIEEGEIGTDTTKEKIKKLKTHIGWLMDFFYSFKDDMEDEITNIYRIIKELEERNS